MREFIPEDSALVQLGDQAERFLSGDLGRALRGKAQQEIDSFKDQLCHVDPSDRDAVAGLQLQLWARYHAIEWLRQMIEARDALLRDESLVEDLDDG